MKTEFNPFAYPLWLGDDGELRLHCEACDKPLMDVEQGLSLAT